eukprot:TRINITY_DN65245_c0_g1_i1.p1 TRINITY_DN65245_c0_g1~~TRINITY_DN65245_c0_g1_i1.p1  ORF type:complete len:382 (+),score=120.07 TRINITY_DN65245_c0_g1_i1:106-1146(+)
MAQDMMAMMQNLWDSPMAAQIAFHPREVSMPSRGAGVLPVTGGDRIGYRLILPEGTARAVVMTFHGNAEVCTDIEGEADVYTKAGCAVLSVDYRGYGWSTGQPSLKKLCSDAEECYEQSREVLRAAGVTATRRIFVGRSIGATCAVHLAALSALQRVACGLIVDSGLMSVKQLPMAAMMATMLGPQGPALFQALPEPFDTLPKLPSVHCPALVMHGDRDEIVPVQQAVSCDAQLTVSVDKTFRRWPGAGHNDVLLVCGAEWRAEVSQLLEKALQFEPLVTVVGEEVETHGLKAADWNGKRGKVIGRQADRVKVLFDTEDKALKHCNLRPVQGAAVSPRHGDAAPGQ